MRWLVVRVVDDAAEIVRLLQFEGAGSMSSTPRFVKMIDLRSSGRPSLPRSHPQVNMDLFITASALVVDS